jgi:hypothetical protein
MREEITLTDEQIEAAFEAVGAGATVSEEYGCDVVFTRETIADFLNAADGYAECGKIEQKTNSLIIRQAQARKGDARADVFVVDFGAVRGVWR